VEYKKVLCCPVAKFARQWQRVSFCDSQGGVSWTAWACGAGIFLVDQWSKKTIAGHGGHHRNVLVLIRFVPHHIHTSRAMFLLTWLMALASVVILRSLGIFDSAVSLAGLSLALGGAASNLFDVLRLRYVINYVDLGWWPAFNLADAAIIAGLAVAFLG
jgi:signal peptidase II